MESKIFRGLAEAYSEVYASEETEQLDEMGQVMTTGQRTAPKAAPRTPQPYRPGGGRQAYNQRRSGITQTAKPDPTAKPAPTARPAAPAPSARPTATSPTSRPTATAPTSRPAAPTQKASPSPTTSTSAPAAAPKRTFNPLMQKTFGYQTGYAPSQVKGDIKKMAQMGSLKASFDIFDLVKGHLLDEGYADTEEAAIKIMANMSEEWKNTIISNL